MPFETTPLLHSLLSLAWVVEARDPYTGGHLWRVSQFNPDLADGLASLAEEGLLEPIIGHSEPHIPLQECVECGPTILVTRRNLDGELVYCRACGGGARLRREAQGISLLDEDIHGDAGQLAAAPDTDLIRDLIAEQFLAALPEANARLA